jgi:hypothetical protein
MFALGFVMFVLSVHLIPLGRAAGLSPSAADNLPFFGFGSGVLLAFAAAASPTAMTVLKIGVAVPLALLAVGGAALSAVLSVLWSVELAASLLPFLLGAAALIGALGSAAAGLGLLYARLAARPGGPQASSAVGAPGASPSTRTGR